MEEQLVLLLTDTQRPEQAPRQQAEIELKRAETNPAFPVALAKIASHTSVDTGARQAALSKLRLFIQKNWAIDDPSTPPIPISDENREVLRQLLLDLALSPENDRLVKIAASYAIGKIALHDFPEQWPNLLPTVLGVIPTGNDAQLHGALKVLGDLVDESLSEGQFFSMARDIASTLTAVAVNESRKPILRALAISVFCGCFDLMEMVKEDHAKEVKAFAEEVLKEWNPFFVTVLKTPLPQEDLNTGRQPDSWNPLIALKHQVVKTLLRIRRVFPSLLLPHSTTFFTAVWEELTLLMPHYEQLYIVNDSQGRLEDADSLPYTLDFLILEELDFLNQCFRAEPVKAELDGQLQAHAAGHEVSWLMDIMKMLVGYSQITREEEELWDIDCSLYLAEEAAVTANYTPRTAAGDLMIKMGEWFKEKTIDALFAYTKSLFTEQGAGWRLQESALFLFVMLVVDFQDLGKPIPEAVSSAYLELVDYAISRPEEALLRARGYLLAGAIGRGFQHPPALIDRMVQCISTEESEVVKVACVKGVENLISAGKIQSDRQVAIVSNIQTLMNEKDAAELEEADELLVVLADGLRAAIGLNHKIALHPDVKAIELLFLLAKIGANNFQVTMVVAEAFEDVVQSLNSPETFPALCERTVPVLVGAYESVDLKEDNPLVTVATELLAVMTENASAPLPEGYVAALLPKMTQLLMASSEGEVLRPGAEAVKYMLIHDPQQVLNWQDESGRSGLEVCLHVIDRLLGPEIEDNSASEIGGLAAALVEKAGQERLGPFLPQLLQAVATRVASAQAASFIQSLILVFARLSLHGAHDVVEFLSQIQINGENGLQVVMAKWLENSISFAGYDEIHQKYVI